MTCRRCSPWALVAAVAGIGSVLAARWLWASAFLCLLGDEAEDGVGDGITGPRHGHDDLHVIAGLDLHRRGPALLVLERLAECLRGHLAARSQVAVSVENQERRQTRSHMLNRPGLSRHLGIVAKDRLHPPLRDAIDAADRDDAADRLFLVD